MKHVTTLRDYCQEIGIPPPRYPFFDIRRFEDNMRTIRPRQPPFRHEFYAVALRTSGQNQEVNGRFLDTNLFFNSPYQVITWDITPNWTGWYVMFDREFLGMNPGWQNFIIDFPFFRLDKAIPMDLRAGDVAFVASLFDRIFQEYHSDRSDKFLFIQAFTQLLLLVTKRYFQETHQESGGDNRQADIVLVSRFQALVETLTTLEEAEPGVRQPSFYADKLHIHPNHLNAVVKRITDKTATTLIQEQLILSAKSFLRQTDLSIKEIGYRLHFLEPTHFGSFFKKATGYTPQQYREQPTL